MEALHRITNQIRLEFDTAEDYICCATVPGVDSRHKQIYLELAKDELSHVDKLVEMGNGIFTDEDKHMKIWNFILQDFLQRSLCDKTKLNLLK